MNNKMNRLFAFLWISFAMMLALIVGVIAFDVYSEDEAVSDVSQGEKVSKKKLRRIRQVKRSESETRIAEPMERMPEAVTEEEGDDEPSKTDAIVRKLAADKTHPLSGEALELLVMVDDPAIKD